MNDVTLYFVIGTEAELIKMFPVIQDVKARKIKYKIITSGQNDVSGSYFLKLINGGKIDIDINRFKGIKKGMLDLARWFFATEMYGRKILKEHFRACDKSRSFIVIHGDTVTTVLGARLAKYLKIKFAHVEAGYRSFNFFCPFPEEIDRYLGSLHSNINFVPGENLVANLAKNRGITVDTKYNTVLETIYFAIKEKKKNPFPQLKKKKYFLFVFHRQENLLNAGLVRDVVEKILELAKQIDCVFLYHTYTKEMLTRHGVFEKITNDHNVVASARVPYLEFLQIVLDAEFVITDGAGNQQELYYLGKPCLLLRKKVEGCEGLGETTILFNNDLNMIKKFGEEYLKYKRNMISTDEIPSKIIVDTIIDYMQ